MKPGHFPKGYTTHDVVREFFPDVTDEEANSILWNETGYPGFWGQGGRKTVVGCLRYSLRRLKTAVDMGKMDCFVCGRRVKIPEPFDDQCPSCREWWPNREDKDGNFVSKEQYFGKEVAQE